jgi:hypothetical protein
LLKANKWPIFSSKNLLNASWNGLPITAQRPCLIPHDAYFDIHPFRFIKGSNEKKLVRITGIIPNTPAIQQIIKDLTQEEKFKLYTTYDTDYRSKLIATLYDFFIRDSNKVSDCKVIYKFIKNICLHWS